MHPRIQTIVIQDRRRCDHMRWERQGAKPEDLWGRRLFLRYTTAEAGALRMWGARGPEWGSEAYGCFDMSWSHRT